MPITYALAIGSSAARTMRRVIIRSRIVAASLAVPALASLLLAPRSPMPAPSFVHLRLHSEYSVVDGTLRIDEAVAAAAADGMPALAITDLSNAFGLIKFYRAARAAGIKPIAGCDVWITHDNERDLPHRAILLAADRGGYLRLCDWMSRAFRTNQHRGRAELRREWFDEGTDGLIALSGGRHGDVGGALLQGNARSAERAASAWAARFPHRYYLEVQRAGFPDDDALVAATVGIASELALPVVATHPVQFASRDDFRPHEARVCIAEGHILADTRRPRRFTTEQYFTTQAEMAEKFADLPQALANTVAIAQRCNLAIPLGKNSPSGLSDARRASRSTSTCATRPRRGSSVGWRRSFRTRSCATGSAPSTSRASTSRPRPSRRWDSRATS